MRCLFRLCCVPRTRFSVEELKNSKWRLEFEVGNLPDRALDAVSGVPSSMVMQS